MKRIFNNIFKKARKNQNGQGMTEYIIIVGLVAILLVGAVTQFKDALKSTYNKSTQKIQNDIAAKIDGGQ